MNIIFSSYSKLVTKCTHRYFRKKSVLLPKSSNTTDSNRKKISQKSAEHIMITPWGKGWQGRNLFQITFSKPKAK